ncbi:hypothetical protein GCM10008942_05830 [Rhizomicrobium electricum]|uniref:ISXO2-like transposase domain-containing protein n=1 Tax=Rhizomicrobium electricum TaxID=480070 RepID=A0ABP3P4H2_9PROT|nr:hypothetical protein [Rhizomicrobium electricum]
MNNNLSNPIFLDADKARQWLEARLFTDESKLDTKGGASFAEHETVCHSKKESARGEVNTNTVEDFFSIFKRGMIGVYQHCDEKHLHRYLAEFDFRYNHREGLGFTDWERAEASFRGIVGKRPNLPGHS